MNLPRHEYYILRGHKAIPVSLDEWGNWFTKADRKVEVTKVGDITVSTVFLGLDHNFSKEGPPMIFETMTFGDDEERCRRYSTWDEAVQGHKEIVSVVKSIVETIVNRRRTQTVKMRQPC